jgi:hypothetical protein
MVSLLSTEFHEILASSFRGVALTNGVTDRRTDRRTDGRTDGQTDRQDKNNMSPHIILLVSDKTQSQKFKLRTLSPYIVFNKT